MTKPKDGWRSCKVARATPLLITNQIDNILFQCYHIRVNSESYNRNGVDYFSCEFSLPEADVLGNMITHLKSPNQEDSYVEAMKGGMIDFREDGTARVKMRRENADAWLTAAGHGLIQYLLTLNQHLEDNAANLGHSQRRFIELQVGRAIGLTLSFDQTAYNLNNQDDQPEV